MTDTTNKLPLLNYLNFDLAIEALTPDATDVATYRARVLHSPNGDNSVKFTLPFNSDQLEIYILKMGRRRRLIRSVSTEEGQVALEFGTQLYNAIFKGEVGNILRSSLAIAAAKPDLGLRLRLRLNDAPDLLDLPWEYLYDPSGHCFFCQSVMTPLVRYQELPQPVIPLAVTPPLKVLVMIANPTDMPVLDVEEERRKIAKALDKLVDARLVSLTYLETGTVETLQHQVRQGGYHVFHFVGHGGMDRLTGDRVIYFEDKSGWHFAVNGNTLAMALADRPSPLRLVLLNTCEGARAHAKDPFAGIAQHLVLKGIPAVIAMQFEITDESAIKLAEAFYTALADNYPVDAALNEARKAIYFTGNDIEWGTPVLYMRAADGKLFDIPKAEDSLPQDSSVPLTDSASTTSQEDKEHGKPVPSKLLNKKLIFVVCSLLAIMLLYVIEQNIQQFAPSLATSVRSPQIIVTDEIVVNTPTFEISPEIALDTLSITPLSSRLALVPPIVTLIVPKPPSTVFLPIIYNGTTNTIAVAERNFLATAIVIFTASPTVVASRQAPATPHPSDTFSAPPTLINIPIVPEIPTPSPTLIPTVTPVVVPAYVPTATQVVPPSVTPTLVPTDTATPIPTPSFTLTPISTITPTDTVTPPPTPTVTLTSVPTVTPTFTPTDTPTVIIPTDTPLISIATNTNLLRRGNFENVGDLKFWVTDPNDRRQFIESPGYTGESLLRSTQLYSSEQSPNWVAIGQVFTIKPETSYSFRAMMRWDHAIQVHVKIHWYRGCKEIITPNELPMDKPESSNGWLLINLPFQSPPGVDTAKVEILHGVLNGTQNITNSTVWIDDISITSESVHLPNAADRVRYIRLIADSEVTGNPWTTVAELKLIDENNNIVDQASWNLACQDSVEEGDEAQKAFDGNINTFWHTQYVSTQPLHPHEIQIDLGQVYSLSGFIYVPRQDLGNGRIAWYRFYVSEDGIYWGQPVAEGIFQNSTAEQRIDFSVRD